MSEWISVHDKLPGEYEVLLFVEYHLIGEKGISIGMRFGDNWAIFDESANEYDPEKLEVTHWMPLPEPPNEG